MGVGGWNLGRGLLVCFAAWLAIPLPSAGTTSDALVELTREPLPFAIRDGRIARLIAFAVPFAPGRQDVAPAVEKALRRLAATMAADCFLTAQVIGHARPGDAGEGDALAAQELARARAERVRSILTRAGLAAGTVANVSDYAFTIQEPRATLWVFRLDQEACKGGNMPEPEPAQTVMSQDPAPVPTGEPLASMEILFEPTSSFFPPGTETGLKRLLARLPKGSGYAFALQAAVGDGTPGQEEGTESARYQRWLAERRLARTADWLEQQAEIRQVTIVRSLLEHDPSGRVIVRVHPLPPQGVTRGPGLPISPGQHGAGGGDGAGDRG